MTRPQKPHTPPSAPGGDGVRIVRREPPGGRWRRWASLLVLGLAIGAGAGYLFYLPQWQTSPPDHAEQEKRTDPAATTVFVASRAHVAAPPRAARLSSPTVHEPEPPDDYELPSQDPDDVSSYISPGDPVPTMADVIAALHDAGIHDGLGAFNPPGTSPPLQGLVVPEDFELPEGYVRHHQVTDEGEPIEPILMFSPDFEFYDESGSRIELPPDRVVPPELAPPGMPLVQVQIPEP
jgi:hypothetical protein